MMAFSASTGRLIASAEIGGVSIPIFMDQRLPTSILSKTAFDRIIADDQDSLSMTLKWQADQEPLSHDFIELPNGRMIPVWKRLHLSLRFFDEFNVYSLYTIIEDVDLESYDFNGAFGTRSLVHSFSSTPFVVYTGYGIIGADSLDKTSYYVDSEMEYYGYKSEAERNERLKEMS